MATAARGKGEGSACHRCGGLGPSRDNPTLPMHPPPLPPRSPGDPVGEISGGKGSGGGTWNIPGFSGPKRQRTRTTPQKVLRRIRRAHARGREVGEKNARRLPYLTSSWNCHNL